MFNPVSIEAVDFMAYEELNYEFAQEQTVMIYGINRDDDGADSNGSGKSSILKMIRVALVDVADGSLTKDDFIRDGRKEAVVRLRLHNALSNTTLDIERILSRTGTNKLTIWENGEVNSQITSVKEGNQRILELLDITREDILNYFIIDQDNSYSFFEASDSDQKKVVSRFTNSVLLDSSIARLEEDLNEVASNIESYETAIGNSEARQETLRESLECERTGRADEFKEKRKVLLASIATEKQRRDSVKADIISQGKQVSVYSEEVQKLAKEDLNVDADDKKYTKARAEAKALRSEMREAADLQQQIDLQLSGIIECPKCGHQWLAADPETDLEDLRSSSVELGALLTNLEVSIKQTEDLTQRLYKRMDEKRYKASELNRKKQALEDHEDRLKRLRKKLTDFDSSIQDLDNRLKGSKAFQVDQGRIDELVSKLTDEKADVDMARNALEEAQRHYEELNFWRINLGMRGFKTFLVNKVLTSLEGYVNFHLNQFRTNLKVKINGFRVNKSGDVSEKIDVLVSRDGDNWKKYKRHSGGQRQRINVCGILTIHKLINLSSKSGGLNMLLLDEFFEGLDAKGQGEILNILQQTQITNLVISHNNTDVGAHNQLIVEYRDGISRLSQS